MGVGGGPGCSLVKQSLGEHFCRSWGGAEEQTRSMAQLYNTAIDYVASGKPLALSGVTSFSVA